METHSRTHYKAFTSPDLNPLQFLPFGTAENLCVRVSSSCWQGRGTSHRTAACQTMRHYSGIFECLWQSMIRRAGVRWSHERHFENLPQMQSFSYSSQIICISTHVNIGMFLFFRCNLSTKFVRTFQVHSVYIILQHHTVALCILTSCSHSLKPSCNFVHIFTLPPLRFFSVHNTTCFGLADYHQMNKMLD
jgi:hypothetical protein